MTDIYIMSAPCGAGKSYFIRKTILESGGQHIIAVPTVKLMADYVASFHQQADQMGLELPLIIPFRADVAGYGATVAQTIAAERERHSQTADAVFIVTHEALRSSMHHKAFNRWTLWIDEVLSVRAHETRHTPALSAYLSAHYDLIEVEGVATVRRIVSKSNLPASAVRSDDVLMGLAELHERVTSGKEKVLTTVTDWSDLATNGDWFTYSRFDPSKLDNFAKVTMLANGIKSTVTYALLKADGVNLIDVPFEGRSWSPRKVTINFFACGHALSASAINQFAKANLKLIESWVSQQPWATPEGHFWMTNKTGIDVTLPGHQASPVSHGLNYLDDRDACSILYRAKPNHIEKAMNRLSGIDEMTVIAEREYETIAQTAFRGSIRCPDKTSDFNITIYDAHQATALSLFLEDSYGIVPILTHVDLPGFDDRAMTRKSGPRVTIVSDAEKAERAERKRVIERERLRAKRAALKAEQSVFVTLGVPVLAGCNPSV